MINTNLMHGDCLTLMNNISDNSIDLILCDLPYGSTSCTWDIIIPFNELWNQYTRILKSNGVVVLFGSQPFTSLMIQSNPKWFREELIWLKNKPASGMNADSKHMKIHENIEVFASTSNYTYNPQKWLVADKDFITQRKTFKDNEYIGNRIYGATTRTRKLDTGERNPLSIVSCRVPFTPQNSKSYSSDNDLRFHPTQKPLELLDYLIKTYSNENDTVLDNCMGAGSTGVSAVRLNRNFVGIELAQEYFNIAEKRINAVINGDSVFISNNEMIVNKNKIKKLF